MFNHHNHKDHHHDRHRKSWGRGRHGMGFGGHHGGRRRAFEQGDLRLVILKLIAEEPRHGYDVIKAIEATFGGTYSPSPGTVYPTLTLLEDQGFATVTPEGTKKLYAVTPEGTAFLEANKATVEALSARMEKTRRTIGRGLAPEIRRALQNFRTAFELRVERGNLTDEGITAIAKAIDDAAAAVERA
jgi:DNA-binding PadR family transcriptional regulator